MNCIEQLRKNNLIAKKNQVHFTINFEEKDETRLIKKNKWEGYF